MESLEPAKIQAFHYYFLAGAVGFEPTTNGFGGHYFLLEFIFNL